MIDQPTFPSVRKVEETLTEDSIRKLAQLAQEEMDERYFLEVSKQWDVPPILQENWETDSFLGYDKD